MFSPRQRRFLTAFADRIIPPGGPFEAAAAPSNTVNRLEAIVDRMDRDQGRGFRFLLSFLDFFPFGSLTGRSFGRMSPERRDQVLERAERSRWYLRRAPYLILRAVVFLAFYEDPRAEAAVGYRPGCVKKPRNWVPLRAPVAGGSARSAPKRGRRSS